MRTIRHIVCAAAAAALVLPGIAGAATPRPGDPSIDQYIEAVATSVGPQPTASVAERVQPLARAAEQQLKARVGSDAAALATIATSSRYGAPLRTGGRPRAERPDKMGGGDEKRALEPVTTQTAETANSRLIALVAFMAASLIAALGYGLVRRSAQRPGL